MASKDLRVNPFDYVGYQTELRKVTVKGLMNNTFRVIRKGFGECRSKR